MREKVTGPDSIVYYKVDALVLALLEQPCQTAIGSALSQVALRDKARF